MEFPPPEYTALVALAQHHGVPTRLLDWTWKPLVAAYFAAASVAARRAPGKTPPSSEPPFSVFALRRNVMDACMHLQPEVHVLTVPTANNRNLHAQGGLFTLIQYKNVDPYPLPNIDDVLQTHEAELRRRQWRENGPTWEFFFPMLVEFRVPPREARTVLRLLNEIGINAATVYPGLDGAVKALRESRFYQWARRRERS